MKPRSKNRPKPDDLSPALRRELLRRIREANDPRRYLLASVFTSKFVLYYNVEHHAYVLGNPEKATAFKSQWAAVAVLKTLGKNVVLIPATRRKDGTLQVSRKSLREAAAITASRRLSKGRT